MNRFNVGVEVFRYDSYPVLVGAGLSDDIYGCIAEHLDCRSGFYTLLDRSVAGLYGDCIEESFVRAGGAGATICVSAGEENKTFSTYREIIEQLLALQMRRRSILVAIGGGVVMDLGGFLGATYMRGVPVVNVPTTLVAQVDAAIGGKVAVNHSAAKNLFGAFHHPKLVICDPRFLHSLDQRQLQSGLAEMIKVAVIASEELFIRLEAEVDRVVAHDVATLEPLIGLAVQAKVALLREDPLEQNLERVLNFGHTLGHVLETVTAFGELTHGEAIAIGMTAATRFAIRQGYCGAETAARILDLLERAGLPTHFAVDGLKPRIKVGLEHVKLIRDGNVNFVVPVCIGKARILKDVDLDDIIASLASRD